MVSEELNTDVPERASTVTCVSAWLYLILVPLNVELRYPLYIHDILVPVFVYHILTGGRWRMVLGSSCRMLLVFFVLVVISIVVNGPKTPDLYEFAIFAYMFVLFAFYSTVSLKPAHLAAYGGGVLSAMFAYAVVSLITGIGPVHEAYLSTPLAPIARRFSFTFNNPNLAGSFAVLPVGCLLLGCRKMFLRLRPARAAVFLAVVFIVCIPVMLTVSRHIIMCLALVMGLVSQHSVAADSRLKDAVLWTGLVSVFAAFFLTVLFPFFPLKGEFPFFDSATFGMYTIHHHAYLRMLFMDGRSVLIGLGRSGCIETYSEAVNIDMARTILGHYGNISLVDVFTSYMDAHNEYLNLAAAFGIPAMVAMYVFWAGTGLKGGSGKRFSGMLVFFVAAVFMASFWDDILSKRWIWTFLGVLAANSAGQTFYGEESGGPQCCSSMPE